MESETNSIIEKLKDYFSYEGRLNRWPYFLRVIGFYVLMFVFFILMIVTYNSIISVFFAIIFLVFFIPGLLFMLMQSIKRLHDLDKSGWYILIRLAGLIPLIGGIISLAFELYLFLAEGTDGPNRFGPDPLGRETKGSDAPVQSTDFSKKSDTPVQSTSFPKKSPSSNVLYDDDGKMISVCVSQGSWSLQTNGGSKYYSQDAGSLLVASEILKQLASIPPQTFYLVDTPDGTLGRDINGFYTEAPIKTTNLMIDNPYEKNESVQAQSLIGFGNMINNQNSIALLKTNGQYAKLILMMKCGQCGYESPIETIEGNMNRQCYCCGAINKTNRGTISVYTANGKIEI